MKRLYFPSLVIFIIYVCLGNALAGQFYAANPETYLDRLKSLKPGDHLWLLPGEYPHGLPIHHLSGTAHAPITISGPKKEPFAIFLGRSGHNTVSLLNARHITIQNLVLDGRNLLVDGVKCEGHADWAHDIILDSLTIIRHGGHQQIVGISTKCPAWNWIVRNNRIIGAGTGMYFGNSDGHAPFVAGLIEHNLISDSLGYNLQIKHQLERPVDVGLPTEPSNTIIRHNVFSKENHSSSGKMARPNVLVGHWPLSGTGQSDQYLIYGNFFYQNTHESLFQGEGKLALYSNLFVNHDGDAIRIQPHNDIPRLTDIFFNTIVASGTGLTLINDENDATSYPQQVAGNAVFSSAPLPGAYTDQNIEAEYQNARHFLTQPFAATGTMNLAPLSGKLMGEPVYIQRFRNYPDWNRDFNDQLRSVSTYGAYSDVPTDMGWLPRLELKPRNVFKPEN